MTKVAVAVIEKDGKILVARRAKEDHFKGKWEFPGGKMETGESPQDCLRRELFEELGIEAEIGLFICSNRYGYSHGKVELLAYRVSCISGDIRRSVHDEIRWVSTDELLAYDFPAANKPIIEKVLAEGGILKKP